MAVAAHITSSIRDPYTAGKPSVAVVCGVPGFATDAIRDYTHLFARSLDPYAAPFVLERDITGRWSLAEASREVALTETQALEALAAADCVLIQYNPFSFGRRGFAPWLPRELLRLRRRAGRPLLALMLHETFVPLLNLRFATMWSWQCAQLFALVHSADLIFASTGVWLEQARAMRPRAPLIHLPVPSNLPDRRAARQRLRRQLGVNDGTIVLAALGTDHPSRRLVDIVAASNRIHELARDAVLLNLGSGAPSLPGMNPLMRVERPGHLDGSALADHVAAADIFLAPFQDGVSTRRSSVMAALQHGLPVVATRSAKTDLALCGHDGLLLEPVGDTERYTAAAVELARTSLEARAALRRSIRELYEDRFDWPVHARTVAGHIGPLSSPDGAPHH